MRALCLCFLGTSVKHKRKAASSERSSSVSVDERAKAAVFTLILLKSQRQLAGPLKLQSEIHILQRSHLSVWSSSNGMVTHDTTYGHVVAAVVLSDMIPNSLCRPPLVIQADVDCQ